MSCKLFISGPYLKLFNIGYLLRNYFHNISSFNQYVILHRYNTVYIVFINILKWLVFLYCQFHFTILFYYVFLSFVFIYIRIFVIFIYLYSYLALFFVLILVNSVLTI